VSSLCGGDDGRVGDEREVDTRVGDQVGLELVQVDIEGTVEAERGGDGRDDWRDALVIAVVFEEWRNITLSNKAVKVLVVGALDAEVPSADVVDGLVVDHEAAVGVLEGGVGGKNRVVGLNDGCGDLGRWVDAELELALLAIVDGQALHQQGAETRASAATEGVEDEETLQTRAVIGNAADLVEHLVDELLADRVVTAGVVVRGVLLACDHLLWVEKRAVGTGADLVDDIGLKIGVDGTGDIFALACAVLVVVRHLLRLELLPTGLGEEGAEAVVIVLSFALVRQETIGLDAVLKAVKLWQRVSLRLRTGGQASDISAPFSPCERLGAS